MAAAGREAGCEHDLLADRPEQVGWRWPVPGVDEGGGGVAWPLAGFCDGAAGRAGFAWPLTGFDDGGMPLGCPISRFADGDWMGRRGPAGRRLAGRATWEREARRA